MINKTHNETHKTLKYDFVILVSGGCRKTKRRERHSLRWQRKGHWGDEHY